MVLQRSTVDMDASLQRALQGQFHIQPEYLDSDELKYELLIRGQEIIGDSRQLTGTLRQLIQRENRDPDQVEFMNVGNPDGEYNSCCAVIPRLRLLLAQVTPEMHTQERFMTPFLHWERRLNRISWPSETQAHRDKVYDRNQCLNDLHNEFMAKIRAFHRVARQTGTIPRPTANNQGEVPSVSAGMGNNNALHQPASQQRAQRPQETQVPTTVDGNTPIDSGPTIATPVVITTSVVQSQGNNADSRENPPDIELPPSTMQGLVNHVPTSRNTQQRLSGTLIVEDNARLSQQFQHPDERAVTPIGPALSPNPYAMDDQQWLFANAEPRPVVNQHTTQPRSVNSEFNQFQIYRDPSRLDYNSSVSRRQQLHREQAIEPTRTNHGRPANSRHVRIDSQSPQHFDEVYNRPIEMSRLQVNMSELADMIRTIAVRQDRAEEQTRRLTQLFNPARMNTSNNDREYTARVPNANNPVHYRRSMIDDRTHVVNHNDHPPRNRYSLPDMDSWAPPRPVHAYDNRYREFTERNVEFNERNVWPNAEDNRNFLARNVPTAQPQHNYRSDFSNGNRNATYNRRALPVHKWNFKFTADKNARDPEERDIVAFLKKIDMYSRAEGIDHDEIFKNFTI